MCAHLFKYDPVFGRYSGKVDFDDKHLILDAKSIRITDQPDPMLCPWHAFGVDIVIEATGRFTHRESAAQHLKAGASKVLITAPATYEDVTIVDPGCLPRRSQRDAGTARDHGADQRRLPDGR